MRPLVELARAAEEVIFRGVLFDLDDTLLTDGVLTEEAYAAMWSLHRGGLALVAVTGRPRGWGEVVTRQWPIRATVTENGPVWVVRDGVRVVVKDTQAPSLRRALTDRLEALVLDVDRACPTLPSTDDVSQRTSDRTWNIGEHVHVEESVVARAIDLIHAHGARAFRSSIHLHATFDAYDKAQGVLECLAHLTGVDPTIATHEFVYIGDSANDAACFAAFTHSVGVANVRKSLGRISVAPRYVTPSTMGAGFSEVARAILTRFQI
jgi:HAD superfamily hydrolase (TIGR01484 family)